ncbi:MAG: phosphoribosylglycinamide formyltransferase [Pseudomonadota bacterium]|nr:phosphoribosylglycinamide formyltransferase [Pseudomonadota bacterium]
MRRRIGILISGRGSNMEAIIRAAGAPGYPAEIATVVSSRPEAAGVRLAAALGVEAIAIDPSAYPDREAFEERLDHHLRSRRVDYVACAGFMRILTQGFVESWRDRIVNIHPSLLPSYAGLCTHERAIADGVRIHGCTVHFVRAALDRGPIVSQAAVQVFPDDTAGALAARVLKVEHAIYPQSLGWLAAGEIGVEDERVVYRFDGARDRGPLASPSLTEWRGRPP